MSKVTSISRKEIKEVALQISKAQFHLEDLKNNLLKRNVDESLIQQILIAVHHSSYDAVKKTSQVFEAANDKNE